MRNVGKVRRAKAKRAKAPRPQTREPQVESEEAARSGDERGLLFEDPYWDDAFCSYYDPTLRTCCRR